MANQDTARFAALEARVLALEVECALKSGANDHEEQPRGKPGKAKPMSAAAVGD